MNISLIFHETKVRKDKFLLSILLHKEEITWFDVAVKKVLSVNVCESSQGVSSKRLQLLFWYIQLHSFVQITFRNLHDKHGVLTKVIWIVKMKEVNKLHNKRAFDRIHEIHLSLYHL